MGHYFRGCNIIWGLVPSCMLTLKLGCVVLTVMSSEFKMEDFVKSYSGGERFDLFSFFGLHCLPFEMSMTRLGFSRSELVFTLTVHALFKQFCGCANKHLLDYVCDFRFKLCRACELARANLETFQAWMKTFLSMSVKAW